MKLQYVFGNPTKGNKKMRKSKKTKNKTKKLKKNPEKRTIYVKKKIGTKTVRGKKSNIYGKKRSQASRKFLTAAELKRMKAHIAAGVAKAAEARQAAKLAKGKAAKKRLRSKAKKIESTVNKMKKMHKNKKSDRRTAIKELSQFIRDMKAIGDDIKVSTKKEITVAKRKRKKKVSRKRKTSGRKKKRVSKKRKASKKRKSSKRRKSRKKAASKKRKSTRRKSSKKRRSRRRKKSAVKASLRVGKKSVSAKIKAKKRLKKGQSVSKKFKRGRKKYRASIRRTNPKRRRNPVIGERMLSQFRQFGPIAGELGALALGGAFYGYSNQLMAKWARPVYNAFQMVPVVGPTLPNIALGAILTMASKKVKNDMAKNVLMTLGQGLIGSGAVGIGVNASQYVPLLSSGMQGVNYYPGKSMEGVNYYSGPTYHVPGGGRSDFGGVDYTPEMSGVNYTAEMGDYAQSSSDFGAYEQSESDYGMEDPSGLS